MTNFARVMILVHETDHTSSVDQQDVLAQHDAVRNSLLRQGYTTESQTCTLNLAALQQAIEHSRPEVIFNLVESLHGTDRLMLLAPLLLDALQIPYSGCGSAAIYSTTNKLRAKQALHRWGLPTPDWQSVESSVEERSGGAPDVVTSGDDHWIIKPIWEHSSFGIEADSVIRPSSHSDLIAELAQRNGESQRPVFAERFVDGREFNLSLLATDGSAPLTLPPAEIVFDSFPKDQPRIVGYRAKWDERSTEYCHTPRRFDFPPSDGPLLQQIHELSQQCWIRFGLRGYARVDLRVDASGQPWILEVNANPCLSLDAGFAAALQRAAC